MSKLSRFLQSRIFWIETISISLIALCLVIGFSYAWNAPTCDPDMGDPSNCNVSAPLNVGATTQTKLGGLNIMNKVGIGTINPQHLLHLYKTNGNAELDIQSVAGANNHWAIYNERIGNSLRFWNNSAPGDKNVLTLTKDGKVGIGTTNPNAELDVNGGVKVGNTDKKNAGTIRWNGSELQYYNGSDWKSISSGGPNCIAECVNKNINCPKNYPHTVITSEGNGCQSGSRFDTKYLLGTSIKISKKCTYSYCFGYELYENLYANGGYVGKVLCRRSNDDPEGYFPSTCHVCCK